MTEPLVTLTVTTRKPEKYLLIDRETGDRWEWRNDRWMRAGVSPSAQYDDDGSFLGHQPPRVRRPPHRGGSSGVVLRLW